MNCKTFQTLLPDLVLAPESELQTAAHQETLAHIAACAACNTEYTELRATFALLDDDHAPEPTPWFDQRMAARLREEQANPPAGFFERLRNRILLNTGANFRPAMTAALAAVLVVGGSGSVMIYQATSAPQQDASATVQDLQILDRNDQALQQLDQLMDDEGSDAGTSVMAPPVS